MIVRMKDAVRLIGISVVACCAVFVCCLFLNYNLDLAGVWDQITDAAGLAMYEAQVSMGKVISAVSGGCLVVTSAVLLIFYVKNYIDMHGKDLGILKALGYSEWSIARHFYVFGLSILLGCVVGFSAAYAMMPYFYRIQNADGLFSEISVNFHPGLLFFLILLPTLFFSVLAMLYAFLQLKRPALSLLREQQVSGRRGHSGKRVAPDRPFLDSLRVHTLRDRKTLVFLIAFSAFCFSSMIQMSLSMKKLASMTFAVMMITIGLLLAFLTLLLSLTSVVKSNAKTIAMMRVFGYSDQAVGKAIFGGYRPVAYLGFAVGTVYQYALLKSVLSIVFADVENLPEYHFSFVALAVSLLLFVAAYELILYLYSLRIRKLSLKSIMLE